MRSNEYYRGTEAIPLSTAGERRIASRRRGLTGKLSLGGALLCMALTLVAGSVAAVAARPRLGSIAAKGAARSADLARGAIEAKLASQAPAAYLRAKAEAGRDVFAALDSRIRRGDLSRQGAYSQAKRLLKSVAFGDLGARGYFAIADREGGMVFSSADEDEASREDLAKRAAALREGYFEFEAEGREGTRPMAAYVAPYDPRGLLVIAVDERSELVKLLGGEDLDAFLSSLGDSDSGYVYLLDAAGKLARGRDPKGLAAASPDGSGMALSASGERLRLESRPIRGSPWTMTMVSPPGPDEGNTGALIAALAAMALLSFALMYACLRHWLSRHLRPISDIQEVADQVSAGDLRGRVEAREDDEIGEVSRLFNKVMDEFAELLQRIKGVISLLGESIQNLSASTQQIASTSNEQAASVKEVLSTMEDADRLSKGVELKIQEVAKIANHTKDNVERGFVLIQSSLGKMEEIRSTNAETLAGIKTLGDLIETIWDIVNIINGIADQTKIIAFNAELEAAAAGDAGKNFRIVAGEIRRLADSTVDSTNEIKLKINEIQHASDKLILASEAGTQRIREGWDVSSNIRGVFEDVLRSSEISATSANEISRSINMQVVSFDQIFLTLKQISESIDSFVESTSYTTEVSDRLKAISESFKAQVEAYVVRDTAAGEGEAR